MKRTLYSGVGLLLVGLLFLAFNLLSSLLLRDQQFDLTQQKLYTFSAGTQEVLDSLDEPLNPVSYTHLRAHETGRNLVCRLLLEKKKKNRQKARIQSSA